MNMIKWEELQKYIAKNGMDGINIKNKSFVSYSEAEHIHGKFRESELRELRNVTLKSQRLFKELNDQKLSKILTKLGSKLKKPDPAIAGTYNSTNGIISIRTNEVKSKTPFGASTPNNFDQIDRVNKMNVAKMRYYNNIEYFTNCLHVMFNKIFIKEKLM